jgi:hypothetical protein
MAKFLTSIIFVFTMLFAAAVANGQIDASTPNGRPSKEELPKNIQETLAKQRIEREKKDYEELLQKSEEAVNLSRELEKSFTAGNQLSNDDLKKLDRLEKLVKKIRSELGGDDDKENAESTEEPQKLSTVQNALQNLQTTAAKLFTEIKKSTRYSVSVVAIQSSNALLKIVKFIRFGK